jgi:DNA-binding transcriptional ArsR family regulator
MTPLDLLLSDMSHKAAIREILWRLSDEEAIQILEELLEEYRQYGAKEGGENGDERAE